MSSGSRTRSSENEPSLPTDLAEDTEMAQPD